MKTESLPVIPQDRKEDMHNLDIREEADLILFMAGNQFMVMPEIVKRFCAKYKEVNNIFYETLPPGLELRQILSGGAVFEGQRITGNADIYTSVSHVGMRTLVLSGKAKEEDVLPYLHNRITLMVQKGNPLKIQEVSDLGGEKVRISQPDPENEDIGYHIVNMYQEAGGSQLVNRIMEEKRAEGTTIMTRVHHRETPLRLLKGTVDVGPVWATEAIHAQATGLAFDTVSPGETLDQRKQVTYYITCLCDAPHPENARKFRDFILTPEIQELYREYGFVPHL